MKYAVATMYAGAIGRDLEEVTKGRHLHHAHRSGADFIPFFFSEMPFHELMLKKMDIMRDLLSARYDRVLWIDADVMIHRWSPNLIASIRPGHFAAFDESQLTTEPELAFRMDHLAITCMEEGYGPPPRSMQYFNCGVMVAEQCHLHLFGKRLNPQPHNWVEQSVINARMQFRHVPTMSLPECWNRFKYWGPKPLCWWDSTYFLHFAGAPSHEERMKDMRRQAKMWEAQGV
jgi:hypothetical protein